MLTTPFQPRRRQRHRRRRVRHSRAGPQPVPQTAVTSAQPCVRLPCALPPGVPHTRSLCDVGIPGNPLGAHSMEVLGPLLAKMTGLNQLSLSGAAAAITCAGVRACGGVQPVEAAQWCPQDAHDDFVACADPHDTGCTIGDGGLVSLCDELTDSTALSCLNVSSTLRRVLCVCLCGGLTTPPSWCVPVPTRQRHLGRWHARLGRHNAAHGKTGERTPWPFVAQWRWRVVLHCTVLTCLPSSSACSNRELHW